MLNKKGFTMNYMVVGIILMVVAIVLLILFYTGQWEKLTGALNLFEDQTIESFPLPGE